MKHTIMCKCGKLAIKCKEASKALNLIVFHAKREVADKIKKRITKMGKDGHVLPRRNIHYCINLIIEEELNTLDTEKLKEGK